MSALPQSSPLLDPPPQGATWIDLSEASRRSGRSIGHLARECRSKYAAQNLARLSTPPQGGKPRWEIHETADAAFSRVQSREQLNENFDRRLLTEKQRQQLQARERVVRQWEILRASAIEHGQNVEIALEEFSRFIDQQWNIKASVRTIYNWHGAFITSGVAGLVDERWKRAASDQPLAGDPFIEEVKRLYLDPVQRSKRLCYDKAKDLAEQPANCWPIPSYRQVCRILDRIPPRALALKRGGDEAYDAANSYSARDYSTLTSNQIWCGDHHRFDVKVLVPGSEASDPKGRRYERPWLTAWMDMRSRIIVGWRIFLHDPNQDTILAALVEGGRRHGFPHEVLIDNGKDYDSRALQGITKKQRLSKKPPQGILDLGIFGNLKIKVHHAQPYRPQSKTIERFFGTVCERFSKLFETYCGGSPESRPHNHDQQLKAGKAPSLEEFIQAFTDWLEGEYHAKEHKGDSMDGLSPAAVHAAHLQSKRVIPDDCIELYTMKRTPLLKVGRNGVTWGGLTYGRNELSSLQGQEIFARIDDEKQGGIRSLQVYRADGSFFAIAPVNQKIPVNADRQLVRAAMAEKQREKKVHKEYFQTRMRVAESLPQRLRRHAAKKAQTDSPPASNPNLSIVRTPLDDQLPAIQKAMERGRLRLAAGAESMSAPPDGSDIHSALDRIFSSPAADADGDGDSFMKLQTAMSQEDSDE